MKNNLTASDERRRGISRVLQFPRIYAAVQNGLSRNDTKRWLAENHYFELIRSSGKVADLGCGEGRFLASFPEVDPIRYVGVDTNPRYIEAAAVAYPEARFLHLDSDDFRVDLPSEVFDFVILSGVLHHLSDSTVQLALATAERLLSPSGLLLTMDPTWRSHPVARTVMGLDRGRHIRTADRYKSLIEHVFGQNQCRAIVHHGLLRVPYAHCLTQTSKRQSLERISHEKVF